MAKNVAMIIYPRLDVISLDANFNSAFEEENKLIVVLFTTNGILDF